MKIVMPGGSGQVGTVLARALGADGHEVVVLSRARAAGALARRSAWDGATVGPWADEVDGSDVVINLAGRSVNCRYGDGEPPGDPGLARARPRGRSDRRSPAATRPPRVWLQASTATIYAHRLRRAERRGDRPPRRRRDATRLPPGGSASTSRRPGSRRSTEAATPAHAQGRAPLGDDDEPGSRAASSPRCSAWCAAGWAGAPATDASTSRGSTTWTSCAPCAS